MATTAGPMSVFVERGHDGRTVAHTSKRTAFRVAGKMGGRANGYVVLAAQHDATGAVASITFPRGDSTGGE
jgi:hypothetical protein